MVSNEAGYCKTHKRKLVQNPTFNFLSIYVNLIPILMISFFNERMNAFIVITHNDINSTLLPVQAYKDKHIAYKAMPK